MSGKCVAFAELQGIKLSEINLEDLRKIRQVQFIKVGRKMERKNTGNWQI